MSEAIKLAAFCGSLRKGSFNRMALHAFIERAPKDVTVETIEIGDWPLYNADIQAQGFPDKVQAAQKTMLAADGILFVTPEYNYGISGVLKNAIDWLSRPWGNGALKDKPLAVIGSALGQYGGVWAHDETRKSFAIAGPRVVEELKLSVPSKAFDGKHPRENAEVAAAVRDVVGKLAAEVS